MTREEIKYKVDEVLHDMLCVGYNEITDDALLADDLGADSLDVAEIVMDLEYEFDISFPDKRLYRYESWTVDDVYNLVEELIQ